MKILFDHQIFAFQNYGGISRYFAEIINLLNDYQDVSLSCPVLFSNNEYIKSNGAIRAHSFFKNSDFKGKGTLIQNIDAAFTSLSILKNDHDIFHPTYYHPYHVRINKKPMVLTCLDLIHEIYIQNDINALKMKRKVLERATKIIAISKHTKNDLMKFYNIPDWKIEVIYLASSFQVMNKLNETSRNESQNYFLYVGKRNLYKNFIPFTEAITQLLHKHRDLFLFCAGGGKFDNEELELFKSLKIENQVRYYPGTDESLHNLYSNAIAFVYPSLYEGFGIPLLEAMSCGCPVLASNTSSLPEVGGDAVLYFDPLKKDSIYYAAELILNDSYLRNDLKSKGFERVREFTWEKTALETHALYKNIL